MPEPLARIALRHATVTLWSDCVTSTFPDGKEVYAAPDGAEGWIGCASHELAHHLLAEVVHDRPSVCLRAVAEGNGRTWNAERIEEEQRALLLGRRLAQVIEAVGQAYGVAAR